MNSASSRKTTWRDWKCNIADRHIKGSILTDGPCVRHLSVGRQIRRKCCRRAFERAHQGKQRKQQQQQQQQQRVHCMGHSYLLSMEAVGASSHQRYIYIAGGACMRNRAQIPRPSAICVHFGLFIFSFDRIITRKAHFEDSGPQLQGTRTTRAGKSGRIRWCIFRSSSQRASGPQRGRLPPEKSTARMRIALLWWSGSLRHSALFLGPR